VSLITSAAESGEALSAHPLHLAALAGMEGIVIIELLT
jgi:hypothetical protein